MLTDRHFPYSSMQEINLDWILTKVKNILRFVPDDGAVGQILRRTAHGAEWSDEQGAGGSVTSVNGMQGAVVLTAADVGALPDTYVAPVDSVNGQTGTVVLSIPSDTSDLTNTAGFVDAAGAAAAAPVQSVNSQTGAVVLGKSDVGLGSVDNVQQYSASNPPPYPVTSVNGQTGAVVLGAADVGAVATGYTTAAATIVGTYIYSMNLAKAGAIKVASYEIRTSSTLIPAAYTLVATLPSGYEPAIQTYNVFIDGDGKRAIIRLDTDGNVYMYNYSGAHLSAAWSIAYI